MGLSQHALGVILNVPVQNISDWEVGRHKPNWTVLDLAFCELERREAAKPKPPVVIWKDVVLVDQD